MRRIKNILVFFITFVATLFIGELYLQLSEINALSVSLPDSKLGTALKPDKKLIFFNEGFYLGGVNKYGYYGPAYSPNKSKDVIRIALIGDSYVEAHQLFDRQSMRALIEKELNEKLKIKVEVLNFGMSGFNLNDDYCYYHDFVKKFNPDISLFFVSDEDFDSHRTSLRRPVCQIDGDSLIINYDFRKNSDFIHRINTQWYRGKSILLGWLFKTRELIQKNLWQPIIFDKFYNLFSNNKSNLHEPKKDKSQILTPVTIKLIKKIVNEPGAFFVEKEPLNPVLDKYIIGKKVIKLDSVFLPKYHIWKTTDTQGHWNSEAHRIVAKTISEIILNHFHKINK